MTGPIEARALAGLTGIRHAFFTRRHQGFALTPLLDGFRIVGIRGLLELCQQGIPCFGGTVQSILN